MRVRGATARGAVPRAISANNQQAGTPQRKSTIPPHLVSAEVPGGPRRIPGRLVFRWRPRERQPTAAIAAAGGPAGEQRRCDGRWLFGGSWGHHFNARWMLSILTHTA